MSLFVPLEWMVQCLITEIERNFTNSIYLNRIFFFSYRYESVLTTWLKDKKIGLATRRGSIIAKSYYSGVQKWSQNHTTLVCKNDRQHQCCGFVNTYPVFTVFIIFEQPFSAASQWNWEDIFCGNFCAPKKLTSDSRFSSFIGVDYWHFEGFEGQFSRSVEKKDLETLLTLMTLCSSHSDSKSSTLKVAFFLFYSLAVV